MGSVVVAPGRWSTGSIAVVQGLVAPWYVGSSQVRDQASSPALAGRVFTNEHPGSPYCSQYFAIKK